METKIASQKLKEIMLTKIRLRKEVEDARKFNYFVSVFNFCLDHLEYEYRTILVKTYFKCQFKFWWVDIYAKTTFYRMRARALTNFVSLFELIYENIEDFAN